MILAALRSTVPPELLPAGLLMLAVWWLLPRPRFRPIWPGALLGLFALFLGGWQLARESGVPVVERFLFFSFSGLALLGGISLVTNRNPARGAISFALVVLSTCGLFLLQAAPFLMAGTVIIYAGAIIVTFLFVIMLAQQQGPSDADNRSREPLFVVAAGFLLLGCMLGVVREHYDRSGIDAFVKQFEEFRAGNGISRDRIPELRHLAENSANLTAARELFEELEDLDAALSDPKRGTDVTPLLERVHALAVRAQSRVGDMAPPRSLSLSDYAGVSPANQPDARQMPSGNVAALGRTLFSDYLLAVELGGTLLLVATIGAIAIAHREGPGVKNAV